MFKEAIECLRKTKSMKPLEFNKEIGIEIPSEEEYKNDKDIFRKKILKESKIKNIEKYYMEAIKGSYTLALMMIFDDTIQMKEKKE